MLSACTPDAWLPTVPTNQDTKTTQATNTPVAIKATTQPPSDALSDEDIQKIVDRILASMRDVELEPSKPAGPNKVGLANSPDPTNEYRDFAQFVGKSVNDYWSSVFERANIRDLYKAPGLFVVSEDPISYGDKQTYTSPASDGPFYHPGSRNIYLPIPSSYVPLWDIDDKMTDFSAAYIIAHEWGHHIQTSLGMWEEYNKMYDNATNPAEKNYLNQKFELQADCFAGTWANSEYYKGTLDIGDIEEAIALANAIGDDVRSGQTDPGKMTHGTGILRHSWFMYGYNSGDPVLCYQVWGTEADAQPTPVPTKIDDFPSSDPQQGSLAKSFFINANAETCKVVDDSFVDTLVTYRCTFTDGIGTIIVDYDEWVGEQAVNNHLNNLRSETDLYVEDTWQTTSTQSFGGQLVGWFSDDGKSMIMWGVNAYRLSGTVYWYNNDTDTAIDWFLNEGSRHYVNP
jgi:uncharacterized protein